MWFLVVSAFIAPHDADKVASGMAANSYPTHAACMADARPRTASLASAGMHGRYMCMRHGESGRELARTTKREF